MARNNFEPCLGVTLPHEGAWSNHPKDPGGGTMKGITIATYRRRRPNATLDDLRRISDAEVRQIYREDYWTPVRGEDLPIGIDMVTFDASVNSGPVQGVKWTQRALGVAADGRVGPDTINAARSAAPVPVIRQAAANRMGMLRGLRTWTTFGRGWSRRVADVEAKAMTMALAAAGSLGSARPVLIEEAASATAAARRDERIATTTGGAGAVGGGGAVNADLPGSALIILAVIVVVGVVLAFGTARHQRARAEAMQRAAKEARA